MSSMEIQQVLSQLRALQARASGSAPELAAPVLGAPTPTPLDFANLMKHTVDDAATTQNQVSALADAYEAGDPSVDLTKVMLEVQKAGIAFHAITEVRNKLIDAYTTVMNMSV
jgi:flagellar hook-basal body complex protein FliE